MQTQQPGQDSNTRTFDQGPNTYINHFGNSTLITRLSHNRIAVNDLTSNLPPDLIKKMLV